MYVITHGAGYILERMNVDVLLRPVCNEVSKLPRLARPTY